jgi:hypothetical protein
MTLIGRSRMHVRGLEGRYADHVGAALPLPPLVQPPCADQAFHIGFHQHLQLCHPHGPTLGHRLEALKG